MAKKSQNPITSINKFLFKYFNKKYYQNCDINSLDSYLRSSNLKYISKVERYRLSRSRANISLEIRQKHYISTSVGGLHCQCGNLAVCGSNFDSPLRSQVLLTELSRKLGEIGKKVEICHRIGYITRNLTVQVKVRDHNWRNPIGNCAEVRVAENFLTRHDHSIANFQDIVFTPARRPRTQEARGGLVLYNKVIPPCINCQIVFYGK